MSGSAGDDEAKSEVHFVFMNYDPEYEKLRSNYNKSKKGGNEHELDLYLSRKHDDLLAKNFLPGTYTKTLSLLIVDGFAVRLTDHQANVLRSDKEVRIVEKNQELAN